MKSLVQNSAPPRLSLIRVQMPPIHGRPDADPHQDAVRRAHAAFRSTADRRLKGLLALGVEGGAASSQLLAADRAAR